MSNPDKKKRQREYQREWEKDNLDRKEYQRQWHNKQRCGNREAYNAYMRQWNAKNRDRLKGKRREQSRNRSIKYRKELLSLFGNCCKRCGFSDWRALQLDHINGKGTQERKATRQGDYTANALLRRFRRNPELAKRTFQLLCANCNWIKRYENKEVRQVD